ncbi:ABC transporter-related protein [Calothrix sp. NIES-4071]|nr:ABC transporter-related protein [Calothrix sp. NIES-4071]BAZ56061.1 ABC transporter-related protein [Calothrix sp. NIES-4105]
MVLELQESTVTTTTEIAVSLRGVSKCFKRYGRPVDRLKELLLPSKSRASEFWALRDINLDIPKGETFGIVGRNGSGKSTMLQIIAGTLTPTTGEVSVKGRVSALLELGSGFNPEFTGRQNVFFNGRLLGLNQKEIEDKFDEIASFADIGDFIEQPVKTYSSGMFVRLAFAVAVNVDPEILIVDEALAVGDIFFQAKCFRKIEEMQRNGVTILFVSHDLGAVQSLCSEGILLDYGQILCKDVPNVITSKFYSLCRTEYEKLDQIEIPSSFIEPLEPEHEPGLIDLSQASRVTNGQAVITKVIATNINDQPQKVFLVGDEIKVVLTVQFNSNCYNVTAGFGIRDKFGKLLCGKHTWYDSPGPLPSVAKGEKLEFTFVVKLAVQAGEYIAFMGLGTQRSENDYDSLDIIQDAFVVNVAGRNKNWGVTSIPGSIDIKRHAITGSKVIL